MRFTLTLGLLVSVALIPAIAEAQPRRYYRHEPDYRREPDYHYRDRERDYRSGLFVRGAAGIGGVAADDDDNDLTLSGGAGVFSLDLGGAVAPNLALHGRLSFNSMFEPTISSGGEAFDTLDDTSLTFTLLGGGLTYYTPSNVYFTGVLGLSRASFEIDGDEYDRLTGVGFMGDIGYEWPLGSDLGLGIGGRLELHSVWNEDEKLQTAALGLLLTLTYF